MAEQVSFVASDELADWLREEADRRALTVEATVQELLVTAYRGTEGETGIAGTDTDAGAEAGTVPTLEMADPGSEPDVGGVTGDEELAALADEVASQSTGTDVLSRHPEAWSVERRGGEKYYVVTVGDKRSVHSSRGGAAETLERRLS